MTKVYLSNDELSALIREEAKKVENGGIPELDSAAKRFLEIGIAPGMHEGKGEEMQGDSDTAVRLRLEWFAGQVVEMSESKSYFAVNSWINMVDRTTKI